MVRHCVGAKDFSRELLGDLFTRADQLRASPEHTLTGKILVTLFAEKSTRTRLSFESAMIRLGGDVISVENAEESSSMGKGESIEDTIRIISKYANAIVIRHRVEGTAHRAALVSKVPIINGGDGKGEHPTQTLLDLYTILREFGRIDGIKIAMVGDLASGRTVRSLCYALANFKDVKITFVSIPQLKIGEDVKQYLRDKGIEFSEESDLNSVLGKADVIYMTRTQKERLNNEEFEAAKGKFVINSSNLPMIKSESRIMHPLPHVEEIDLPIEIEDGDSRVAYFRQAENGVYARMALLDYLLRR